MLNQPNNRLFFNFKRWMPLCAFLIGCFSAPPLLAACSIQAATFAFGEYRPLTSLPVSSNASITLSGCRNRNVRIELSAGNSGNVRPNRQLRNTSDSSQLLSYNLYKNSAYSTIWGLGSDSLTVNVTTNSYSRTVYGRIPGAQDVSAGTYMDTITTTITF